MKKFSITQLETARRNPAAFANAIKVSEKSTPRKYSKYMVWLNSVYTFHNENDLLNANNYFENSFRKHFKDNKKNQKDLEDYLILLELYIDSLNLNQLFYIEKKINIVIPISDNLAIGGHLPIVCMDNKSGYSVFFFTKDSSSWQNELRFPIIQDYVASKLYGVSLSEVQVGIFGLDVKAHQFKSYSESEINDAKYELNAITMKISSEFL